MSVLDPLTHALAVVVTASHAGLTSLGSDPASGTTWVLSIAAVVVAVRVALLPLAVHSVRQAHATARARPQLTELAHRYRNRKDRESIGAFAKERRLIAAQHRVSRWSVLPLLLQLPIWLALYHLVANLANGVPVGAMDLALTASLGAATVWAVPLAAQGYLGGGWTHVAVVAGLAGTAAVLSYVTQRFLVAPTMIPTDMPDVMVRTQQMLPAISAMGLLVAGGVVPVALLVYWVCNAGWTLVQSAVVLRWFPTPGSPAAARRAPAPRRS